MVGEGFFEGNGMASLSPMKQLLFLEGSNTNCLGFDIETYSPRGFPYFMEDLIVNFSLVTSLRGKGVFALSVLVEPYLEKEALCWLNCLLSVFKGFTLITYNGSKFDLEYVNHRGKRYGLDFSDVFSGLGHFDVYKAVKESVHLQSYSQKVVERFLGISRVVCDVNGACYHRFFDEFSLHSSLKPMFYNIEDSFGCLRIADALVRKLNFR